MASPKTNRLLCANQKVASSSFEFCSFDWLRNSHLKALNLFVRSFLRQTTISSRSLLLDNKVSHNLYLD